MPQTIDFVPDTDAPAAIDFTPDESAPVRPGYEPYKANMADVGISGGEFDNVQPVKLPVYGKPGTFGRGVSQAVSGMVEFGTSTPGVALAPAFMIPGVGPALATAMGAGAVWQGSEELGNAIENKDWEAAGRGAALLGMGGLGVLGGAHGISESAKLMPRSTKEVVQQVTESPIATPEPVTEPAYSGPTPPKIAAVEQAARRAEIKAARPVVPETPPEPERGLTVLDEIRAKGADTKEKIRALFPTLNRETAAQLRDQAFPREKVLDNLSRQDVDRLFLRQLNEESNRAIEQAYALRKGTEAPLSPVEQDEILAELDKELGEKPEVPKAEPEAAPPIEEPTPAPAVPESVTPVTSEAEPAPLVESQEQPVKVGDVIEAKSHQISDLTHKGKVVSVRGQEIGMVNQDNAPVLVRQKNIQKVEPEAPEPKAELAPVASAKAPELVPVAVVKEPWRMTFSEYENQLSAEQKRPVNKAINRSNHKEFIQQALERGEDVPPEVLRDYPALTRMVTGKAPPTEPEISPGPGAAAAGEPGTYSAIAQLSDKLKTTPASTPADGLRMREKAADIWAEGKGLVQGALGRLRAVPETLKAQYSHVRSLDDVTRRVAEFDYAIQSSAGKSRQAAAAIKQSVRNTDMRNGMAFYMEGATEAQIRDTLANLPEGTKPYVRRALEAALKLPKDVRENASDMADFYALRGDEVIQEGIMEKLLDDYYTHVWKNPKNMPSNLANALNRGRVNEYFQYAMRRKIPTLLEGIREGKEPLLDPASVIPRYNTLLDRAIASRRLMKSLEDLTVTETDPATGKTRQRPLLAPTGTRKTIYDQNQVPQARLIKIHIAGEKASDYRAIDHPSLRKWIWAATDEQGVPVFYEGDLRVHPEHYERLARMMDRSRLTSGPIERKLLAASTEVKGFKLGVASFFHPIQVGTHALFHRISPLVYGEINWDSPKVRFAIEKGGLQIGPDPRAVSNFAEGILTRGLVNKIPGIGPMSQALSEWTFSDYIPRLKLATFEHFYERAKKWYPNLTNEQAAARAGDAVNNAYGELNQLWLGKNGRDPKTQRLLRLAFLAPDFGEARLRFVMKAFTKYGGEERLGLLTAGIGLWLAARAGNIMSHGDPETDDLKHLFDVKMGDRWVGVRSIVGDIGHLITKPRQFWEVRLNPLYSRSLLALLSGRDVVGHKLTPERFAGDVAKQVVPIHLSGLTRDDRQVWESFLGAMGLQTWKAGATSEIHRLAQDWRQKRGIKDDTETLTDPDSPYRKARLALEFGDRVRFRQAVEQLYQKRRAVADPTPRLTIKKNFERYYHQPFSGNQRLETSFKSTLSREQQSVYHQAQQEREKLWKQFQTWY